MNSITNIATGQLLDLPANQPLTIEQAAGWLSDDELPGAFSYPISAPLTPANERFLQYGYRPDAAKPSMDIPVIVQLQGVLYRRCTFSYRLQDGEIDGYLKIDAGEVYDQLKQLSLLQALSTPINLGNPIGVTLEQRMNTVAALPPGASPFTFFPIRNELMLETELDAAIVPYTRQAYVNVWTPTGFRIDSGTAAATRGFLVVPQFYLSWVLTTLFSSVGYRITGDWIGNPEVQRLVIFNQTAMRTTTSLIGGGFGSLLHGYTLTPGMHLPDMSVSDFLKAIRTRLGLTYSFNANDKTVSIRRFSDVVAHARPQNLTPYQLAKYGIDAPDGKGFTVLDYIDETDELFKDKITGAVIKPAALVIGAGGNPIQLKCGTTQLIYEPSPLGGSTARWFVPTVRQPGNVIDPYYAKSDRALQLNPGETVAVRKYNVGLKLLSYRGMTQDSGGHSYPLGTPDVRDGMQNVIGTEGCALTGAGGLWTTCLRSYYYFRDNTRKVTANAQLPAAQVSSLKLDETIQFSLDGQARVSFLPTKLSAETAGVSGKLMTKLELLTLPVGLGQAPAVADPLVWIELVQTTTDANTPLPNGGGTRLGKATKLEVNVWADRAKTRHAVAQNLTVNIRRKTTAVNVNKITTYSEPVVIYPVSGSYALLEAALLSYTDLSAGFTANSLTIVCQLDPGAGYNIL